MATMAAAGDHSALYEYLDNAGTSPLNALHQCSIEFLYHPLLLLMDELRKGVPPPTDPKRVFFFFFFFLSSFFLPFEEN